MVKVEEKKTNAAWNGLVAHVHTYRGSQHGDTELDAEVKQLELTNIGLRHAKSGRHESLLRIHSR
tara:strand:- start:1239 stop:1433 length:195 start_codon:yes stop_codon:yes gene_type:complete